MKPRVFVVMPYDVKEVQPAAPATGAEPARPAVSVNFNDVYGLLIGPALKAADCEPFRADEEAAAGDIRTDMYFELVTADFVVADVSILNANVFYELGIRHGVARRGILLIHGGWGKPPFDIVPDRRFEYAGALFVVGRARDDAWQSSLQAEVTRLAGVFRKAIANDAQKAGSPVYEELVGLEPVDWSRLETARARYFRGVDDDWQSRVRVASREGRTGDVLTLAGDAPTRFHHVQLLFRAARGLIDLERFDFAEEVLREVLAVDPDHFPARCQLGLVLGRLKRYAEAQDLMAAAARSRPGDPEAQGILGRVYKDLWRVRWQEEPTLEARQRRAVERSQLAASAIRSYNAAFRRDLGSYYNGINVLALQALLDHLAQATGMVPADSGLADADAVAAVLRVAVGCALERARQAGDEEEVTWASATLGELAVVEGRADEARRCYAESLTPSVTYFQIRSMLSQLDLFRALGFQPQAADAAVGLLEEALQDVPGPGPAARKVILASGHMIDAPDRPRPRFPPGKETAVRARIEQVLDTWGVGPGDLTIGGGARGADILVAEACLARGAKARQLIALPEGEFLKKSVRLPGTDWEARYFALRDRCETWLQDERLGPPPAGMSPFARNNLWCLNTARAEPRTERLYAVLVWDEQPTGDGPGGTSHFAAELDRLKVRREIINPTKL